jgi:CarboxypepD_reg-like domain/TonB-dependent Receptor Plug Domain
MISCTIRVCFILTCIVGPVSLVSAQPDWTTVPWTTVGDSTSARSKQIILLTGKITNKASNEAATGASVSVDQFKYFDYTDAQGKFLLEVPPGNYRIIVRHLGMKPRYLRVRALSGGVMNVEMEEGKIDLEEVIITSRAIDSNIKQAITGLTQLEMQEIKTLPTFMGEVDILKSIQTLPGVSSVGEGSSGFNVRGGRTDQNLVLLNGAPLFNASHALGFVSAFNQDVINNFTLYKGNVPANFGGRASSVLEINTRQGDFEKWKFQSGVGLASSRFLAEGPLVKDKTSLLVATRVSHSDWLLRKVKNPDVKNSSLFFYDANLNLAHRFSENSSLRLSAYSSRDFFQFAQQFAYAWENYLTNMEWRSFANRKVSPVLSVVYGRYNSTLIDPSGVDASQLNNRLDYWQVKETVNFIPNEQHNLVGGFEATAFLPKPEELGPYNGNTSVNRKRVDKNHGWEAAVFVQEDLQLSESISLSAGLRYSFYNHIGLDTVYKYQAGLPQTTASQIDTLYYSRGESIKTFSGLEPRISARFSLSEKQSIKLGYNRMRQYIHLISNTTSPTPVDLWQVSNEFIPPQIADNYSLGFFWNLDDNVWETSIEGFYKSMSNLLEYKNFPTLYLNRHIETELVSGKGRAYGGELYLRRLKGRWTGWASYTYSQTEIKTESPYDSESINGGEWFPSNYNKPHTFNLVMNRRYLKGGAFSFLIAYNTGRPFTAVESSYIDAGTVVPIYSKRNQYQIPNYFRFDLSFTIPNVVAKLDDSLVFSVYNLFGRDNAYSLFYQRPASNFFIPKAYKLSVLGAAMPSLTYNFKF